MYGRIFLLRFLNSGLFFGYTVLHTFYFSGSPDALAWGYIGVNILSSIVSMLKGWDGMRDITRMTRASLGQLAGFGKYTLFTMIGTSLLRSADTLIISLSPLGAPAVALYSIPLKLTEIQQIPLRSFAATAFPKMSKASLEGDRNHVRTLFYDYSGALGLLFLAFSLFCIFFAGPIVHLLAGHSYDATVVAGQASPVVILQVLAVYGMLLPLDRMTGIALDSIDRPRVNAIKVFIMLITNVVGDLVAVFLFKSLLWVAIGSILFTLVGIWIGYRFLDRELTLDHGMIYKHGVRFYSPYVQRFRHILKWRTVNPVQ
jgi:O-antigen/teichoic acid export membrane protein